MKIEITNQERTELQKIVELLKTDDSSEFYKLGISLIVSLKERFKGYYIYYHIGSVIKPKFISIDPETFNPKSCKFYCILDFDFMIMRISMKKYSGFERYAISEFVKFANLILEENNHFIRKNDY